MELWALLSPRCPPLLKCTIQLTSAVQLSGKAHEDSVQVVVIAVLHWCLCAETHPCGKVVRAVIMFCLRFGRHCSIVLDQLRSVVITWCALIAASRKLADYNYTSSLALLNDAWVRAGGCKQSLQRYLEGQSRTYYQECGCHLKYKNIIILILLLSWESGMAWVIPAVPASMGLLKLSCDIYHISGTPWIY